MKTKSMDFSKSGRKIFIIEDAQSFLEEVKKDEDAYTSLVEVLREAVLKREYEGAAVSLSMVQPEIIIPNVMELVRDNKNLFFDILDGTEVEDFRNFLIDFISIGDFFDRHLEEEVLERIRIVAGLMSKYSSYLICESVFGRFDLEFPGMKYFSKEVIKIIGVEDFATFLVNSEREKPDDYYFKRGYHKLWKLLTVAAE